MLGMLAYTAYYKFFTKKLYIDPIEYREFNKAVPLEEGCSTEGDISYYYYDGEGIENANNKFGLYIYPDNEKFVELADELINSNGGDWGYVLIPYNVKDTDREKWVRLFYLLNKKHLIPIVQLWNIDPYDFESDTKKAAEFLDGLTWPVKTRYISVYNEPNAADFWYGRIDPAEYAQILDFTIDHFKKINNNFFIMNGALNVSALSSVSYMDAFKFMSAMDDAKPGIFNKLDGWASHSYPQPNFSGDPLDTGRNSIRAYETELDFLKTELGISKELPVFITETGWAHDAGRIYDPFYISVDDAAENFKEAYRKVWLQDDKVIAVTPFSIWYESPGDHFSWVDARYIPYRQFQTVKAMKKTAGTPEILKTGNLTSLGCE